jgi:hypothetical protein
MISPSLRKLVLAAAVALMPLQGIAAGLMSMLPCHGDTQAHSNAEGGGHRHDSDPASQDGGGDGTVAYHPCCHSTASASVPVTLPASLPDSPVRTLAADAPRELFVPEQPQRPPLA